MLHFKVVRSSVVNPQCYYGSFLFGPTLLSEISRKLEQVATFIVCKKRIW